MIENASDYYQIDPTIRFSYEAACRFSPKGLIVDRLITRHKIYDRIVTNLEKLEARFVYDWERQLVFDLRRGTYIPLWDNAANGREISILEARIITVPNHLQFGPITESLLQDFGCMALDDVDGLLELDGHLFLDLEGTGTEDGFMMPNCVNGLITGLKVYCGAERYHPFMLGTRHGLKVPGREW